MKPHVSLFLFGLSALLVACGQSEPPEEISDGIYLTKARAKEWIGGESLALQNAQGRAKAHCENQQREVEVLNTSTHSTLRKHRHHGEWFIPTPTGFAEVEFTCLKREDDKLRDPNAWN